MSLTSRHFRIQGEHERSPLRCFPESLPVVFLETRGHCGLLKKMMQAPQIGNRGYRFIFSRSIPVEEHSR